MWPDNVQPFPAMRRVLDDPVRLSYSRGCSEANGEPNKLIALPHSHAIPVPEAVAPVVKALASQLPRASVVVHARDGECVAWRAHHDRIKLTFDDCRYECVCQAVVEHVVVLSIEYVDLNARTS